MSGQDDKPDEGENLTPWQKYNEKFYGWQKGMTAREIREEYARRANYQWPWKYGVVTCLGGDNYGKRFVILMDEDGAPWLMLEENPIDPKDKEAFDYETHLIIAGYYRVYHAESD